MSAQKIPMRKCVGCNEMKPKKELIRVLSNDDGVMIDTSMRANGRGAYICNSKACFRAAVKNKGLERSLKVRISDELISQLEDSITGE